MKITLKTKRLVCEPLQHSDWDFMKRLVNSEGWLTFIGDRNIHSDQEAMDYVDRINNNPDTIYWVVKLKAKNISIGIISFVKRDYLPFHDIGFALLPEYTGRGYAKEATGKILEMLKQHPEYQEVLAATLPSNSRSIKLLTALGFVFQSRMETGKKFVDIYTNNCKIGIIYF